jgi:hypothetical protein
MVLVRATYRNIESNETYETWEDDGVTEQFDLAAWRASACCSPMQGKLALGQAEWAKVETYRDTEATWAQRIIIDSAQEWRRNSEDIQFFGYLLQFNDDQMDALFAAAMQISA